MSDVISAPPGSVEPNENFISHTSANILCNYMKKSSYLEKALQSMAIKPRYVEEIIDYLGLMNLYSISFPMSCFCDIPLSKVNDHMEKYGSYGIAFEKNKVLKQNVQPIIYLNSESAYGRDYINALHQLIEREEPVDKSLEFLPDFLLSVMMYTKPISGKMRVKENDESVIKPFYFRDECEWRYIPTDIPNDMDRVLTTTWNNDNGRERFSNALTKYKKSWFNFAVDDIVYLIVPNEDAAIKLIRFIRSSGFARYGLSIDDRNRLISKIEIADKFDKNLI